MIKCATSTTYEILRVDLGKESGKPREIGQGNAAEAASEVKPVKWVGRRVREWERGREAYKEKRRPAGAGRRSIVYLVCTALGEHAANNFVRDSLGLRYRNVGVANRGTDVGVTERDLNVG